MKKLLELLSLHGGKIVCSSSLSTEEINKAREDGRMYVDEDGIGFVYAQSDDPSELLKEAVNRNEELTGAFHRLMAEFKTVDAHGNMSAHLSKNRYDKVMEFLSKIKGV